VYVSQKEKNGVRKCGSSNNCEIVHMGRSYRPNTVDNFIGRLSGVPQGLEVRTLYWQCRKPLECSSALKIPLHDKMLCTPRTVQTTSEGTPFSCSVNTPLCDFWYAGAIEKHLLTYLLTYSQVYMILRIKVKPNLYICYSHWWHEAMTRASQEVEPQVNPLKPSVIIMVTLRTFSPIKA